MKEFKLTYLDWEAVWDKFDIWMNKQEDKDSWEARIDWEHQQVRIEKIVDF